MARAAQPPADGGDPGAVRRGAPRQRGRGSGEFRPRRRGVHGSAAHPRPRVARPRQRNQRLRATAGGRRPRQPRRTHLRRGAPRCPGAEGSARRDCGTRGRRPGRRVSSRRRPGSRVRPDRLPHLPVLAAGRRNRGRAARGQGPPWRFYRLSVPRTRSLCQRRSDTVADLAGRLADRAPVRVRDVCRLPVLRAAAVCRGYPHPGSDLAVRLGRRPAAAQRHRPARPLALLRRPDAEPVSVGSAAGDQHLLAVLDRDGARLLDAPRRPGIRPRAAAGGRKRPRLVRAADRSRHRAARAARLLVVCRLGRALAVRSGAGPRRRARGRARAAPPSSRSNSLAPSTMLQNSAGPSVAPTWPHAMRRSPPA